MQKSELIAIIPFDVKSSASVYWCWIDSQETEFGVK